MNNDLTDLYQQLIIDHSQHPHNFHALENPTYFKEGFNSLCGDRILLYLIEKQYQITDAAFEGEGCAISIASASLMTDLIKNHPIEELLEIVDNFQLLATTGEFRLPSSFKKLAAFSKIHEYPMRAKCATLAWHTLKAALNSSKS